MQKKNNTVFVDKYTNGILDPLSPMLGPIENGGYMVVNTAPGCWGPMITPQIRGGHEVSQPVYVQDAEIGDSIVLNIVSVSITSKATSSGTEKVISDRCIGDPYVAGKCQKCGTIYPKTRVKGVGQGAIRCAKCGEEAAPFELENGYTMVFDESRRIGITVNEEAAEKIGLNGREYMQTPGNSVQNPCVTMAPSDLKGIVTRMRPFIGQLGTIPKSRFPDSHNAGDFGVFLIDAPHEYSKKEDELLDRTDGHLDINKVREGATLVCPVKVKGGGVYVGDVHALQGEGEIAGHTCDVSAIVTLKVGIIKNLCLDGPILFPLVEDLPYLAKPINDKEYSIAEKEGENWKVSDLEKTAPISFIGTGANINEAIENGISRASEVLGMSRSEIKNRITISGGIEIGRSPGVVVISLRVSVDALETIGLGQIVREKYNIK